MLRQKEWLPLIIIGAVVLIRTVRGTDLYYHLDLDVYCAGAQALLAGRSLYDGAFVVSQAVLPFTYPPFAALAMTPVALVPWPVLSVAWTLMLAFLTWFCARTLVDARADTLWATAALLLTQPWENNLVFGQINIVLAALILTDILVLQRSPARGVLTGLAIAIKLTPAVFMAVFLFRRDYRGAGTAVASALAATGLAWLIAPADSFTYWTSTVFGADRIGGLAFYTNQSLRGIGERIAPSYAEPLWLCSVIVLALLLAVALYRYRHDSVALVLLSSLGALLGSPVSWSHHWIWMGLIALVFFQRGCRRGAAAIWLVLTVRILEIVNNLHPEETTWNAWQQVMGNSYVWLGVIVLMLAVCGRWPAASSSTPGKAPAL